MLDKQDVRLRHEDSPRSYTGKIPVRIVIMFHGGGGAARGAMRKIGWAQKRPTRRCLGVMWSITV